MGGMGRVVGLGIRGSANGCVAGSPGEVIHLQPDALVTNMFAVPPETGEPGPDVTRTSVTSPTTAVVEWVGAVVDA